MSRPLIWRACGLTVILALCTPGGHGLHTGAYLSPHVLGFAERVQIAGEPMDEKALSSAVARVEAAVGVTIQQRAVGQRRIRGRRHVRRFRHKHGSRF